MNIVCIPVLVIVLKAKETETGRSLNRQEVEDNRDNATGISFPDEVTTCKYPAYPDLDPDNVWDEWVAYKTSLDSFNITTRNRFHRKLTSLIKVTSCSTVDTIIPNILIF